MLLIEVNQIYNEDCLIGMSKIDNCTIKTIVTSPPYNLGGDFHTFVNGKRVTYGDYNTYKDKVSEDDYQQWQISFLNESYRILKDDGVMFYNHKNRIVKGSIISPLKWIDQTKLNIYQIVVLNFKSTANVDKRRFFPVYELLYVLTKNNKVKLNNEECLTDVWEMKKVPRRVSGHPATFHIDLPLRCIKSSTNEGDIVLDTYIGTGTTALACIETKRKFIGFENDDTYYKLAKDRANKHILDLNMQDLYSIIA